MNTNLGIIGKKLGMTQFFTDDGTVMRCTVVESDLTVIGKRTKEKNGYDALIVGLGERKPKQTNTPLAGQYKKSGQTPKQFVREMRLSPETIAKYEIGAKLKLDEVFQVGQHVDVQGITRGRGFTGVMRRWSFAGAVSTHGSHEYKRHGGSIGTNMTPGRTLPGLKMPGQYGSEKVSVHNLKVAKIVADQNLLLIAGGVPGARNTVVTVKGAIKKKNAGAPVEPKPQTGKGSKAPPAK